MQKIVPCLWFDGAAEEAAAFYASLVPDSEVGAITRYGKVGQEIHGQGEGTVMTAEFLLAGTEIVAMNGGPLFRFTPAISLFVTLPDRADVDRVWDGLIEGGRPLMPLDAYPWAPRYGWLADRWGLTWQVALGDPAASGRRLVPSLMFTGAEAGRAEEAMNLWTGLLPDSGVAGVLRWDGAESPDRAGTVKHAQFRLAGETFMAMDSALTHDFGFNEAVSLMVLCEDQAEIDRLWAAMSAVPEAEACGWLKDRFGVSWQITPRDTLQMLAGPDRAAADRAMAAFMDMKKIDIARLEAAFAA
ncbi:VOC family protein [Amaricoccus sp.]|uniref:VOC family protein n=1 Tax=Amaricoccus sp. TaxID=1872485 RepID=UPI001B5EE868|nr:VOC family protein [Amaricoccus sp.]MBP7240906.1 VOC family protein [Amaricoccus sp.]